MSLSKVKSVQNTGSFENEYGAEQTNPDLPNHGKNLLHKFEYEMECGTVLTANHKTTTSPFPAGSDVDYEVTKTHPEHGKSGKVKKPDSGHFQSKPSGGSKGGYGGNRSFALSYAKDVLVASYMTQNNDILALSTDQMFSLAEKMDKWLDKQEPKAQPDNSPKAEPEKVKEVIQSATDALMNEEKSKNQALDEERERDEAARAEAQIDDLPF